MASLLFNLALLLYFVSSVCYHIHLFVGHDPARKAAMSTLVAGVAIHTAAIGVFCTAGGKVLQGLMPLSIAAYFLAVAQLGVTFRKGWTSLGSLTAPLAFLLEFGAVAPGPGSVVANAAAAGAIRPHVMVLMLAFAAFTLAFCLALLYLFQSWLLKTKQVRGSFSRLPPLEKLTNAAHWLATIGFSMLTLGMITGAIAAPERWGPGWYLMAPTLSSVVAWLVYAAYLGVSLLLGWRGRKTTYFLLAGFVLLLIAFVSSVNRPHA